MTAQSVILPLPSDHARFIVLRLKDLSIEELEKTIKDSDYADFEEFKEQESAQDNEFLQSLDK